MKQRFNALDVRATVINLRERLVGIRLQNVYDVNQKTFLFKFAKPDFKELVLVRKYLRTRRVTNVRQLGIDRIVDFEFAGGEKSMGYHLICEFYASGNIILTDQDYTIIALLRIVPPTDTLKVAVGETYNIKSVLTDFEKVDVHKVKEVLARAGPKDTLKKILNIGFEYGPAMIEHIILEAGLDPNMKVTTQFDSSEGSPMLSSLLDGFKKGDDIIESTKNEVPNGYIILLDEKNIPNKEKKEQEEQEEIEIYDEFHPFLYKQFEGRKHKDYPLFDKAVDEFFSAIEAQKLELKSRRQEEAALKKLDAVRKEQASRVQTLLDQQITNVRKAQLIEMNLQLVDAAITIIRNAVASQMDWQDLQDLVKEEKRRQNPIAMAIEELKLKTNQITLVLTDPEDYEESDSDDDDDDDSEDEEEKEKERNTTPKSFKVDIDMGLTAFANARKYYEQKKTTATKHEKTIVASSKALKSAERKIRQDLKETKITATINKIRKPFWFEKFLWFISTEGHLIIAGRDMQQNEMLVKRYLLKDDVYVHADLHGAASVVVKNKPQANGQPIPPSTLFQAGIMSVCQSKAWDAKMVTSAYWVYPDQVSKSAPTGEYLTTGSFMIRGKKNFLPPVQLVYGFGYLFKLDESCIGNHVKGITGEEEEEEEEGKGKPSNESYRDAIEIEAETKENEDENVNTPQGTATPEDKSEDEETDSDSDSSSDDDENAFPDTQLQSLNSQVDQDQKSPSSTTTPESNTDKPGWNKYDLEEYGEDSDEQEYEKNENKTGGSSKKFISAKERRLMKKNNVTELTDEIRAEHAKQKQAQKQKQSQKQQQAKPKEVVPPASTRGRKGKAKKIKDKYGDQDDEERQIRMEILGSNKGPQPKGKKAKRDAKAKAEKIEKEKELAEKKAKLEDERAAAAKKKEEEENDDQPLHTEGTDEKDTEAIRQMLKEENITMLEADEIANLSALDSLTPNPLAEDIIHFAIPVCAPYVALQKYKYKVKLTPGSLKRGKAIKQAQSVFFHISDATAREKELIKGVPEMEAINTMMGKVKVSAPNLEASKRKKGGKK
ncbi:hypothetical protein K501DRAFT_294252 [Backusella circina FSU 941]|nr:hypothetical protein K501DRAFT_294252 [Backusella circina FSU 941]